MSAKTPPIAIVGISCLFPKADDLHAYWANIKNGVNAITPVPEGSHWNAADYFDADPKSPDRTYARSGGFLSPVNFNPMEFGMAPKDIEATDTSQLLSMVAAQRALAGGMTTVRVFELVRRVREFSQVPVVFYTYYNLVFSNGVEAYVQAAKEAGVDGMLTLDLPPEEADEVLAACKKHGLKTVFIVAPTTPAARLPKIGAAATGFIYYVSREGVTGVRDQVAANIPEAVARIREHTKLPVVVGFGISTREQVRQVARCADGVVVGSALVNVIRENLDNRAGLPARLRISAAELVAGIA